MREPVFTVSALLRQRRAGEHYDSDVRVFEKNSTGAKSATPQGLILRVKSPIFRTNDEVRLLATLLAILISFYIVTTQDL